MRASRTPPQERQRSDAAVRAKIVYYGPASSGKTTNLEILHRAFAAADGHELFTVKTDKDRTLFFDMLPVDLGRFRDRRVVVNLCAVPGQVRYEATRKVVLGQADAIVFVADSRSSRREQNVWSLQNLHMNLRAAGREPEDVPVLFQFNKRDLPDAASMSEVSEWLGAEEGHAVQAVATRGEGVLESLGRACRTILPGLAEAAAPAELEQWVDRVLASHEARLADASSGEPAPDAAPSPIVLTDDDLLERAIETSVRLSEGRFEEATRSRRLAREVEASRRLGESLFEAGASVDRSGTLAAALAVAGELADVRAVTLLRQTANGHVLQEGSAHCDEDPLLGFDRGRRLLQSLLVAEGPTEIGDLAAACGGQAAAGRLKSLTALAALPVGGEERRILVAYTSRDGSGFEPDELEFLGSVARHLAVGLERASVHEDLTRQRGRLETRVGRRERRRGSRRAVDQVRESLLANFPGEMRTTLATVGSAVVALRSLRGGGRERRALLDSLGGAVGLLQRQLDDLAQLIHVTAAEPLRLAEVAPRRLIREALRIAGHDHVRARVDEPVKLARFDLQGLARALAHLVDNAVKFSPPGSPVTVSLRKGRVETAAGAVDAMVVSVIDRGPGVPEKERERIFAPFTKGKKATSKKSSGFGIGLYEARAQARRHGGSLEHFPRSRGGSEFRLTVPLKPTCKPATTEVAHA